MPNASDIITYIGIPLAVLGVLPIFYTCLTSLLTLRSIRRKLKADGVQPLSVSSSLMTGVVEVALPRFSITPLDRDGDPEYWKLSRRPSRLVGGTWTTFNWNCLITGSQLYRLQYSDELQVPKAEIDFQELISFLLDRGAVPDVKGLHMLRTSRLWTPTGTSLMLSPDTTQQVLKVALPDDSEGVLSLTLHWTAAWDNDMNGRLRPGWMSIDAPLLLASKAKKHAWREEDMAVTDMGRLVEVEKDLTQEPAEDNIPTEICEKPDTDIARSRQPSPPSTVSTALALRLRFRHSGSALTISDAIWFYDGQPAADANSMAHLKDSPSSDWIPSIALALGLSRSLPLYNHSLDHSLTALTTRDVVPCGVLVTLGIISEGDGPSWETKYDPFEGDPGRHARFMAQVRSMAAEDKMDPDQARAARSARQTLELEDMTNQRMEKFRRDQHRQIKRKREAVASPRLETIVVMNAALKYLIEDRCVNDASSLQDVVETVVVGIMMGDAQALGSCAILQKWRKWSDQGGMTTEDLDQLASEKQAFCFAACVMGLLHEICSREESTVAADMRECVQHWKKVRLG